MAFFFIPESTLLLPSVTGSQVQLLERHHPRQAMSSDRRVTVCPSNSNITAAALKSSNWEDLPADILDLILNKLFRLSDYYRFGSVCKHWLYVAQKQKHLRLDPYNKQLPLLFIPNRFPGRKNKPCLYDIKTAAIYDTELQWDYNRRCCGSCFGWLATVDMNLALSFTHPFSGRTVKFPSIAELDPEDVGESYPYEYKFRKAILSKDPNLFPNDYLVIAIHYNYLRFSCIKPGGKDWIEIEDKRLRPLSDVIIYKGLVYAVSSYGGVGSLDISEDFDDSIRSKMHVIIPNKMEFAQLSYLVESSQGELFYVRRFIKLGEFKYKTWKFDIFKLVKDDEEEGKMKWFEVNILGEDALFLGDNHSMSIMASNFPNCKSNCIYYTDNFNDDGYEGHTGSFDMGIYNVDDKSFGTHYFMPSSHKDLPPPIWILPI